MPYRVFLVEDEIITREGIRDNVDWGSVGFEFCGEAPDGEIAIPLIEETKPDVLITDIKMPFMDGLQLSKIIREHMPWVKIIILSGHNEFEYAQSAVKLGVTEYLLKPVSAKDIHQVLESLSGTLDREHQARQKLKSLQNDVEKNLLLGREKFLLKLVMGGISSAEAIEQSQQFGLNIVARYYIIILIRIELCEDKRPFDYHECQRVEHIVSQFAGNNPDVFLTKKDLEELILLIKGDSQEQLVQEGDFIARLVKNEVKKHTSCNSVIQIGCPQDRLGNIHHSFAEALVKSRSIQTNPTGYQVNSEKMDLIRIDHDAIGNYLKFGSIQEFDVFFSRTLLVICETALDSNLMKQYFFVDIILTVTQFISDLGENVERLTSDIQEIDNFLEGVQSVEQIKTEMRKLFSTAISIRNSQTNHERTLMFQQSKTYLDKHFSDPELRMSIVAQKFSISPSHFSTIFRQEFGETFSDYLGKLRLNHAKLLLRTTNMKIAEVAYRSGFNDSHYFSYVFKKNTGSTPRQYRSQS